MDILLWESIHEPGRASRQGQVMVRLQWAAAARAARTGQLLFFLVHEESSIEMMTAGRIISTKRMSSVAPMIILLR